MSKRVTLFVLSIVLLVFTWNFAEAQFGKNKVQYRTFNWKYIETPHFDIYFYDSAAYLAHFTAVAAEASLQSIQSKLNHNINHRITLVVYNSHNEFQQNNIIDSYMSDGVGGVTELLKNRIVVPFPGEWEQYRHVVHHELCHAVLNDLFYGGTIQSALSTGNTVGIPLWMNEGFAEFESLGGYNKETDMYMRDITLSEYLPPLQYISGYMSYRAGQAFWWYVAEKYGEEKIGDVFNKLRLSGNLNLVFKAAFDMSVEDFSEQWEKDMKKIYWPDLELYKFPEDYAIQITNHRKENNWYNSSPAISPNGEKMAYISDDIGLYALYVRNIEKKSKPEKLVTSLRKQDFEDLNMVTPGISWNPDGTKIAVSAKAGPEDAIFIVDAKSGDYEKITFGISSITSVDWSPDGKMLAFIGNKKQQSDIFTYTFATKKLDVVTSDPFSDLHPLWSWDSKKIYFISDRGDLTDNKHTAKNFRIWKTDYNQSDIYSISLADKRITRITNTPEYSKTSMAISPDEKKILFVSDKNGIGNLYEMDLETKITKPKTNSLSQLSKISLSKDGSKLLFSTQTKGGYDIFMLRYPFDKSLEVDSLPNTKLVIKEKEKANLLAKKDLLTADTTSTPTKTTGYGNIKIDFTHQQVIMPNPDAAKPIKNPINAQILNESIEDTTFAINDYKVKFSPDLIRANPAVSTYWGFQGGFQMLYSDIMGDNQIFLYANLYIDLNNSNFAASYQYKPQIIDYTVTAFHSVGYVSNYALLSDGYHMYYNRFRNWGISSEASYPFDLFNRMDIGLNIWHVSKEVNATNNLPDSVISESDVSRFILIPQLSYVHDNSLYGMFGPVIGSRFNITFKGVPKLSDNGIGFATLTADYRQYLYLGMGTSIALRGAGGKSFGPNPRNFYLGGEELWLYNSSDYLNVAIKEPEDFAFMEFCMPMRGWNIAEAVGTQYFLANAEIRFPLLGASYGGFLAYFFQGIYGNLFLDIGGAWSGSITDFKSTKKDDYGNSIPNDLLMSAGIGLRTYLLGMPFKIDIAWRNEFYNWSSPWWLFSLGYDW